MQIVERFLSQRFKLNPAARHDDSIVHLIESYKSKTYLWEACPLCQHQQAYCVSHRANENLPTTTLLCQQCGLLYAQERFDDTFWQEYYCRIKSQQDNQSAQLAITFDKRTSPQSFSFSRFHLVKQLLGEAKYNQINQVFEFGCADGANLYPYLQDGKKVFGFDYNSSKVNEGKKRGLNLKSASFEECLEQLEKADLVILSHVVEHFPDPIQVLKQLLQKAKPEAIFYFEIPGLFGHNNHKVLMDLPYQSSTNLLAYLQFEHRFHFDRESFVLLLKSLGLKITYSDQWVRVLCVKEDRPIEGVFQVEKRGDEVFKRLLKIENGHHNPLLRLRNALSRRLRLKHQFSKSKQH